MDINVDVFVTVDDEQVGPKNFKWKSEYGYHKLEIDPNTDLFKPGLFRVAFVTIQPSAEDEEHTASVPPDRVILRTELTLE